MTVGEATDLDRYAAKFGMSRSVFLRDCVRRIIASEKAKASKLRGRDDV